MLWVALDCPQLPLEALLRGLPSSRSAAEARAVADSRRILACNAAAQALGVRPGLGLATARARATGLRVLTQDVAAEAAALGALAAWLCRFTPLVSLAPPRAVLAEIEGSLRLFGGARALTARMKAGSAALGFDAVLAVGCTPRAALWRVAGGGGRLEALPLHATGADDTTLEFLHGIGVRTVGDLIKLPRAGLADRVPRALLEDLDRALGDRPEPRVWFRLPERFRARLELPAEVCDAQAVLFAARRLLLQLEAFLVARQSGARGFLLTLLRRQAPAISVRVGLAAPLADAEHFTILLRERLAGVSLDAPVEALCLEADDLAEAPRRSGSLFGDPQADHEGWLRLLERLRARLGEHAVHGLAIHPEHRPERAWRRVEPGVQPVQATRPAGPRPLWLLDPPRRTAESGFTLLAGPERIETGWWDGDEARRDYFIARDRDSALLWVYRERGLEGGWYVHGIFA